MWRRRHDLPHSDDDLPPLISRTLDLDADGKNETLYCYSHTRRESLGWDVSCLSSAGELRWRLTPTRTVRNSRQAFPPPYVVREFTVFPSPEKDGTWWTAAVFVHHVEYCDSRRSRSD